MHCSTQAVLLLVAPCFYSVAGYQSALDAALVTSEGQVTLALTRKAKTDPGEEPSRMAIDSHGGVEQRRGSSLAEAWTSQGRVSLMNEHKSKSRKAKVRKHGGRGGKGEVQSTPINIEFGGTEHGHNPGDSYGSYLTRPENVKSNACDSTGCQSCSSPASCFHGVDDKPWGSSSGTWGFLSVDVPAGGAFTYYTAEVWAQCASSIGGKWWIWSDQSRVSNGVLSVYADTEDGEEVIKEDWKPNKDGEYLMKDYTGKMRIRVVFHPDQAKDAKAALWIEAYAVDERVDDCMGLKTCLSDLGDGSAAAFELRNENGVQQKCLQGDTNDMSTELKEKCETWRQCTSDTGKMDEILALLKAANMGVEGSGALLAVNGSTDAEQCVDPSIDDPESWDCECSETWTAHCSEGENAAKPLETCLNEVMCGSSGICNSWKEGHCESGSLLAAQVDGTASSMTQRKLTRSGRKSVVREDETLDDSLQDKCRG